MTGRDLVDDYRVVAELKDGVGLSVAAAVASVRNGIDKAFVDDEEKTRIKAIIEQKLLEAEQ